MYSHIFYRDTFFDQHTLTPMTYAPKHAKVLYVCELEKLIKLTIDIPASLHSHIQEDAEHIIESLYAHAYQCNIINLFCIIPECYVPRNNGCRNISSESVYIDKPRIRIDAKQDSGK